MYEKITNLIIVDIIPSVIERTEGQCYDTRQKADSGSTRYTEQDGLLAKILPVQQKDFEEIYEALGFISFTIFFTFSSE